MLISAIVGLFASLVLAIKTYWYRIKAFFKRKPAKIRHRRWGCLRVGQHGANTANYLRTGAISSFIPRVVRTGIILNPWLPYSMTTCSVKSPISLPIRNDAGLKRQHELFRSICIPEGFFLTLHFNFQKADVVVMTMMDLGNLQLKKSINPVHYIYLFHSLGSTHMVDHANSYDAYDSLFCVGPHHVAELRKRESMQGLEATQPV